MSSIVHYTDRHRPVVAYPLRIVSPTHAGPCCFTDMEPVGKPEPEGEWVLQYWRCRRCGYTVRRIRAGRLDPALVAGLQADFRALFGARGRAA